MVLTEYMENALSVRLFRLIYALQIVGEQVKD